MGEAYNGITKDWAIVDVPPGTKRVEMEGVGGGKEEVTWQRYNGVRRSKFIPEAEGGGERERERERERELVVDIRGRDREREVLDVSVRETRELVQQVDNRDRGRRFVAEKTKEDVMWTEITKDLVTKEAIEASGYGFEETEFFFYVMEYLRYVSFFALLFSFPPAPPRNFFGGEIGGCVRWEGWRDGDGNGERGMWILLTGFLAITGGCAPPGRSVRRNPQGEEREDSRDSVGEGTFAASGAGEGEGEEETVGVGVG